MIDRALRDAGESVPSQASQQSTPAAQ